MLREGVHDPEFEKDLSITNLQGVITQFIGMKYLQKNLLEKKLAVDFLMKDTEL